MGTWVERTYCSLSANGSQNTRPFTMDRALRPISFLLCFGRELEFAESFHWEGAREKTDAAKEKPVGEHSVDERGNMPARASFT